MPSLQGYATQLNPTTQIVCAYASGSKTLKARAGTERWIVQGTFEVPEPVTEARLQVVGLATSGAVARVAIFNPAKLTTSEVTIPAAVAESVSVSGVFSLEAGVTYQIAACVTCTAELDSRFAVIRTCSLV
jgi:hypothetical protein